MDGSIVVRHPLCMATVFIIVGMLWYLCAGNAGPSNGDTGVELHYHVSPSPAPAASAAPLVLDFAPGTGIGGNSYPAFLTVVGSDAYLYFSGKA